MQASYWNYLIKPLLLHCDVPTIIQFSKTCHLGRQYATSSLDSKLNYFLDFCREIYNNDPYPSLDKRIFSQWTSLHQLKILEKIKTVFDLLKFFYEVIPQDQQLHLLQLPCPSFQNKMLQPSKDWSLYTQADSCIKELTKIGLFEKTCFFEVQREKLGFHKCPGGAFYKLYGQLHFVEFREHFEIAYTCEIKTSLNEDMTWKNVQKLYNQFFLDHDIAVLTPLSDLRVKKECYVKLRSEITKMKIFCRKISREGTQKMSVFQYCLRYAKKRKDDYGNLRIMLSARYTHYQVAHFFMDISGLQTLSEFEQMVQRYLTELNQISVDAMLHRQQSRRSLQDLDILPHPSLEW